VLSIFVFGFLAVFSFIFDCW